MKSSKVLLAVGLLCLLLAASPAQANPGRAAYVNGHNYKVSIDRDGFITVSKGDPVNGIFTTTDSDTFSSPYSVCRTFNKVPGESLAVFDDKIYYAYTADTPGNPADTSSCTDPGHGMSVWVAVFDLSPTATVRWLSNRAIGPVAIKYQTSSASGAAITVFDNQLYLFSDSGIYTSLNGIAWSGPYPAFETSGWEPLDAVTIYPENQDPRMLIVYGLQTSSAYLYYSSLWGATWNGKFGDEQSYRPSPSPPFPYGTQQQILGNVSLLVGTASANIGSGDWGAKEAAVQLLARAKVGTKDVIQHLEFTYGTSTGMWRVDPTTYGSSVNNLLVYFTSQQECMPFAPPDNWDLRQLLVLNWTEGSTAKNMTWASDALTPQNRDIAISACGDPGGTETNSTAADPNDPEVLRTRQHYWTLLGVILGSPPFAQNGYTAFADYQNFSNVNYGQDITTGVEQTQSMSNSIMISAGTEVHAGLADVASAGVSVDMSYKHAWESSNGESVTQQLKRTDLMGTQNSACTELGKWGWALFEAPTVIYQDWKAYAYDYSPYMGSGSLLFGTSTMDLHTIKVKEVAGHPEASFTAKSAYFELSNPGGPNDEYPGLMSGMRPFSSSLNTSFWLNPGFTWASDPRWETKLGEGTLPQLQFGGAHSNETSWSQSDQSWDAEGQTNDVSLTEGVNFSVGSKVNGMSGYFKIGYAGSFKANTKATTGFGTQLTFLEKMRSCNYSSPDCVSSLTVQPYWLTPTTGDCDPANGECAPWVPTAFRSQKPWAITWKIWDMSPTAGMNITGPTCPPPPAATSQMVGSSPGATNFDGAGRAGTTLPPANASGRIVSGMGGGLGGEPSSHYAIQQGRLAWFLDGTERRIPMTADQFDPSTGVSVQIQELSWPLTTDNGTWTRSGHVWRFQSKGKEDRVTMKIDFRSATYDLEFQKVDLSGRVPAGTTILRLVVTVSDRYKFYTELKHDVDVAWRWSLPAPDAKALHVTSIDGRYNTATKTGQTSIAGTLPEELPAFGDVEVRVNEHPYLAKLVSLADFQRAVQAGGSFKQAKEGLILYFDFGDKTWSVTFENKAFQELLAPQVGVFRTKISVGGAPWYQATNSVLDYSANLRLQK